MVNFRIDEIRGIVDVLRSESAGAHAELQDQMRDMAETSREVYASKRELTVGLDAVHESITQLRRELGEERNRIFDLLQRRLPRPRGTP